MRTGAPNFLRGDGALMGRRNCPTHVVQRRLRLLRSGRSLNCEWSPLGPEWQRRGQLGGVQCHAALPTDTSRGPTPGQARLTIPLRLQRWVADPRRARSLRGFEK